MDPEQGNVVFITHACVRQDHEVIGLTLKLLRQNDHVLVSRSKAALAKFWIMFGHQIGKDDPESKLKTLGNQNWN